MTGQRRSPPGPRVGGKVGHQVPRLPVTPVRGRGEEQRRGRLGAAGTVGQSRARHRCGVPCPVGIPGGSRDSKDCPTRTRDRGGGGS